MSSKALTIFDWSERTRMKEQQSPQSLSSRQPIITPKEARKLLGQKAKSLTNGELEELIFNTETLVRLSVRNYIGSKNSLYSDIINAK